MKNIKKLQGYEGPSRLLASIMIIVPILISIYLYKFGFYYLRSLFHIQKHEDWLGLVWIIWGAICIIVAIIHLIKQNKKDLNKKTEAFYQAFSIILFGSIFIGAIVVAVIVLLWPLILIISFILGIFCLYTNDI